ncbi:hypothetical protein CAPTEDRAFT_165793 [Capitella teleta]|uniref:Integrator complex subunit 10 n=1 Tax=Capitella teleta TaxID=283909 RepID=R7V361_CAPTE|nr:hypothetical protein CAPTEDRAFT_165793 [Capitella teleta]|eukprot:ELU13278.1 hypothetical protein CAPTEDRAFT_165793 [Capitella teleta]
MASVGGFDKLSNEGWLISEARSRIKSDQYAAKSWILVARTIFPRSFMIQYEAYQMEKDSKNIKGMAKLLEEMLMNFPGEPQLWAEVQLITDALQDDNHKAKNNILKNAFNTLPPNLQCHLLLRISESTADVMQQSRLLLLVLRRYPHQVADQGVKLIDSLLNAENVLPNSPAVNCYRKVLVCDVLPLVLGVSLPQVSHKQLYRWLQKSIEFYISFLTQSESDASPAGWTSHPSSSMQSPNYSLPRRVSISGLSEAESVINDPWQQLFDLSDVTLLMVGFRGWEWQWQQIQMMHDSLTAHPDPSLHIKQVFYCCLITFFHSVHFYCSHAHPHSGGRTPLVLLDVFKEQENAESVVFLSIFHRHKKLKADMSSAPQILPGPLPESVKLASAFGLAVNCWELLSSNEALEKDFEKIFLTWKPQTLNWIVNFEVDILVYRGYFKDAVSKIHAIPRLPHMTMKNELQLVCCHFNSGSYSRACDVALTVVGKLAGGSSSQKPFEPQPTSKGRQLQFMPCTDTEALPYCLHLIIACLKDKVFKFAMPNDLAMGHLLVLIQYQWPRYEETFRDIVTKITHQGSFSYSTFFNYIISILCGLVKRRSF